jgi:hypothetical protein
LTTIKNASLLELALIPGSVKYALPPITTEFAPYVGTPTAVALFAEPDLSFQTEILVPEENVILAEEESAPSNQSEHPVICVGKKYG